MNGGAASSEIDRVRAELRRLAPELHARWGLRVTGIFGSLARGEQGPASDLDLLVELDRPLGLGFVDAADFLELQLGRRVDLLTRRSLRPHLWAEIAPDLVDA